MSTILAILFFGLGVIITGVLINLFTVWVGILVLIIIIFAVLICVFLCNEHPKEIIGIAVATVVIILIVLKIHDVIWVL